MIFIPKQPVNWSESAIRPDEQFMKWRELMEQEVKQKFLSDPSILADCACPGCGSQDKEAAFEIFGMSYYWCDGCGTLFASPRPSQAALDKFYQESGAARFWDDEVIKRTFDERRANHWRPLANWLSEVIKAYCPGAKRAADYRPKFYSVFNYLDGLKIERVTLVSPLFVEDSPAASFESVRAPALTSDNGGYDVLAAFNVVEREAEPSRFLRESAKSLNTGGLLFLTTNTISGFEYQVLGGRSPNLVPPDRLQLLSVEALEKMITKAGLEIIELITPGKLDVDIVAKEYFKHPNFPMPDFLKYIFKHRDRGVLSSLQNFLQLNNLSSFLRAVAIKR